MTEYSFNRNWSWRELMFEQCCCDGDFGTFERQPRRAAAALAQAKEAASQTYGRGQDRARSSSGHGLSAKPQYSRAHAQGNQMDELSVRVRSIRREALDINSFELVRSDGGPLTAFTPGSHIDVHLGPDLVRQYSLCSRPDETARYMIAVKKEPDSRGGSRAMHERIKEGDVLTISTPRNNFPLAAAASHHLLLAGGIGVTPLLSMARHLLDTNASFELQYFSRSIQHTPFHDLLSGPEFKGKVVFHYALEPEAVRAYLRRILWQHPPGAHLYLCGPRPFMDLVETTAAPTWPPEAVHLEYFAANPTSLSGPRVTFKVRLARSGGEYEIPADKSIVRALAEHGIQIETSCQQGVCGTCLTGLLEGMPDHRDVFLTDEEKDAGDKVMPCVSRARSEILVLDL